MHKIELEKAYNPKSFEDRIYAQWLESGAFSPVESQDGKPPYVIVIPPPNVTGVLHMGHGLNQTLQDIVIRFHRMRGEPTLWVPGTDHAGIATQNVVEKRLKAQGKHRSDMSREDFTNETWKVKAEHHAVISKQIAVMGNSVDWTRERFTLDQGLSLAVRDVFVSLYERNLLYKGNYLVNWCIGCGTALADDEVEHEDTPGKMYHIRYPYADQSGFVELATTRPETLFGDTAVAVHPDDERYKHLIGKTVHLPLTDRDIPVIADPYIDPNFGTGLMKITPAHDINDWEVGKRHDLQVISILTQDGRLNAEVPPKYRNMTIALAREAVVQDLKAQGLLIKEEEIVHSVGRCYRCNTVIEPFLSEQWFVRMKPLAEKALDAWKRGEIVFYPKRWENTYAHWLANIRDWCVSRQLWWGHRIPAWICASCGKTTVSRTDVEQCPHCGGAVVQDPDVLDTWFSSWLWPFSTLGWEGVEQAKREKPADLRRFYPTTALITAYDIIFFWVSRMIMAGLEFTGQVPFRDIYIHGLVRDKQGRKMSKSLGNGLDPLELVDEFGADAVKFTLAYLCAQGQDVLIDKDSFKLGSRFANKVWNASRFILMNLEGRNLIENPSLRMVDRWIHSRLNTAAKAMTDAFLSYRYNDAASVADSFFWNDFCDWYVEAMKLSLRSDDEVEKDRAVSVLLDVLAQALRLLHPLIPFVTEEIYGKLPNTEEPLITAPYPLPVFNEEDAEIEKNFGILQDLTRRIRTLRSECTVPPEKKARVTVNFESVLASAEFEEFLRENSSLVKLLANISELSCSIGDEKSSTQGAIGLVGNGFEAFVFIADAVDLSFLKQKFTKELEKDKRFIGNLETKLANEDFLRNAPPDLVKNEQAKRATAYTRVEKLTAYVRDMGLGAQK
ncbi:MAG: valine--tRNA ligase [Treponema sp.]|jgi:valyl-tRNA synthetase|nr:valine--tRNA ligase [Treponema sp.]